MNWKSSRSLRQDQQSPSPHNANRQVLVNCKENLMWHFQEPSCNEANKLSRQLSGVVFDFVPHNPERRRTWLPCIQVVDDLVASILYHLNCHILGEVVDMAVRSSKFAQIAPKDGSHGYIQGDVNYFIVALRMYFSQKAEIVFEMFKDIHE